MIAQKPVPGPIRWSDDGAAANHKRNIYAKLEVHSQAQLFDLFLRSLTAG